MTDAEVVAEVVPKSRQLLKFGMTEAEKAHFREELSKADPKLIKFRDSIKNTDSDFIPSVIADVMKGYSVIIMICGRPRSGKSKFGLLLATIFSAFLYLKWFEYKGNVFFFPRNLLKSITDEGYEIKVQDEAGKDLNKSKYYSELPIAFDQIIQTQGVLVNIYIFVLPFASDLVKDLRKYVDYICKVKKRGVVNIKKVLKEEDQLVSELKAFKVIPIEELTFTGNEVPKALWEEFENKSFEIKKKIRQKITKGLGTEEDWLYEGVED